MHGVQTDAEELLKSMTHITVEIIEYVEKAVVIKTILKKTTGSISIVSFDSGEGLMEKTSPFDTFIQLIEGNAVVIIGGIEHAMKTGESIVVPAHTSNLIKPNGRFKIIQTIIKSGYE